SAARNNSRSSVLTLDIGNVLFTNVFRVDGNAKLLLTFVVKNSVFMRSVGLVSQLNNGSVFRLQLCPCFSNTFTFVIRWNALAGLARLASLFLFLAGLAQCFTRGTTTNLVPWVAALVTDS